jgi:hypothetical protein
MNTYQKTKNMTLRPGTVSSPTFVHSGTGAPGSYPSRGFYVGARHGPYIKDLALS